MQTFELHGLLDAQKKPSAVASELREVELSVRRIARMTEKWRNDANLHASMYFELVSAANKWKSANPAAARNVSQYSHGTPSGNIDPSSQQFVSDFFNSAQIMKSVIGIAVKRLEASKATTPEKSAIQSLIGSRLPTIFEYTFGIRFTMTVSSSYETHSHGVEFIRRVLSLFGVVKSDGGDLSPHTIKRHYAEARKKDQSSPKKDAD